MNAVLAPDDAHQLRVPPHSIEAESSVLGALLLDAPKAWPLVSDTLSAADFYRHEHQLVFGSIARLVHAGHPVDTIAVAEELRDHGLLDQVGGVAYMADLTQYMPSPERVTAHAGIVADHARRRAAIARADELAQAAFRGDALALRNAAEELATLKLDGEDVVFPGQGRPARAFVPLGDFRKGQTLQWLVKGVIPRAALGAIYGAPGSGKSFLALDLAMTLARGLPTWAGGHRVKKSRVGYVVAEGAVGFRGRLNGYLKEHGLTDADVPDLQIMDSAPNLLEPADVRELIAKIKAANGFDVIFVDTLARCVPGAEENSSQDMGRALAACELIRESTGAMVLLLAHSGKVDRGIRGWSGVLGALDVELKVEENETTGQRSATLTKMKDGPGEGDALHFSLLPVHLGDDEDGDAITSCTVKLLSNNPAAGAPAKSTAGPNREAIAAQVLNLLRSEQEQGRHYGVRSLHDACGGVAKLSRDQMKAAVAMLIAGGEVEERQRPRAGRGGGAKYLHVATASERADHAGQPMGAQS